MASSSQGGEPHTSAQIWLVAKIRLGLRIQILFTIILVSRSRLAYISVCGHIEKTREEVQQRLCALLFTFNSWAMKQRGQELWAVFCISVNYWLSDSRLYFKLQNKVPIIVLPDNKHKLELCSHSSQLIHCICEIPLLKSKWNITISELFKHQRGEKRKKHLSSHAFLSHKL